jgi:hypothetical protein
MNKWLAIQLKEIVETPLFSSLKGEKIVFGDMMYFERQARVVVKTRLKANRSMPS